MFIFNHTKLQHYLKFKEIKLLLNIKDIYK